MLWLTAPRESNTASPLNEKTGLVIRNQKGFSKKEMHGETIPAVSNGGNGNRYQLPRARKSGKKEFPEKWKRYHIVPTLDENDIVNVDFKSRQTYSTICAPLFIWVGFIGRNVITNLPQNNIADVAGRRSVTYIMYDI